MRIAGLYFTKVAMFIREAPSLSLLSLAVEHPSHTRNVTSSILVAGKYIFKARRTDNTERRNREHRVFLYLVVYVSTNTTYVNAWFPVGRI